MFQVLQLYLTEKHDNFVKCAVSPGIMSRIEVTHITYWFDSKWGGAWLVLKYTLSFNLWSFSMLVIHSSTLTVPNNSQSFQSALLALFYNNLTQAGDNWERERERASIEKIAPLDCSVCTVFLNRDSCGTKSNVGGSTFGQFFLCHTREQAKQANRNKSFKTSPPWTLFEFLPPDFCLEYLFWFHRMTVYKLQLK